MTESEPKSLWRRPYIESSCLFTNKEDTSFMSKLLIDSSDFLDEVDDRDICPRCYKSRKYFCYNCYVPMDSVKERIPIVKLPVKIDIVKHPKEVDGKSTSAHAAVLAPEDVSVYIYPNFPDYSQERVILMFPGRNAMPFQDWWNAQYVKENHFVDGQSELLSKSCKQSISKTDSIKCHQNDKGVVKACAEVSLNCQTARTAIIESKETVPHMSSDGNCCRQSLPFDKVVFIDSTWNQTKRIYGDERIRKLPCVVLTSHRSYFWRHQRNKPITYLATIEAIYYFLVELHHLMKPTSEYQGQYDNMLFFFKFMYNKIRTLYDPKLLRNSEIYPDSDSS